jgi:O-acetylhomoserine (thiol)-lyase
LEEAITPKSKVIFIETLGNPTGEIVDLDAISKIAKKHGLPLVVDNTFGTPYLIKPIEHGANIIVHSATKFLGGHGTTIAGTIVDGGNFNWKDKKFESFNTPDPGYNGLTYSDLGEQAFIVKARVRLLRDTGAALSPFNAFLILQGIETLSLRVERHVENAKKAAEYLNSNPEVDWITHPEFTTEEQKELADKYYKKGVGSIFTIGMHGGKERAKRFIENLEVFSHLANVADAKSLIIHPASTTHGQLNEEQLVAAGIKSEMIRISVGLENIDDLIADLENAIKKSK